MSDSKVVKSVARVFEVLELFARKQEPLSGMDVCRALGYPKSSANAILRSLVTLGYLSLNPENLKYFPSLRVTYLGDWVPKLILGTVETGALLKELQRVTRETVTLSMQNEFHMQFIRVLPGTFPISLSLSDGFMAPIFGTAVGTAYLSTLTDKAIRDLYRRADRRGALDSQDRNLDAILADVASAREEGCARGYERILPDTGAVAVPLKTDAYDQHLVIGVGGLAERIRRSEHEIVQLLTRAIRQHVEDSRHVA